MSKKKKIIYTSLILSLVLIIIMIPLLSQEDTVTGTSKSEINTQVALAESMLFDNKEFVSYFNYDEFILETPEGTTQIEMPNDSFLVSIAPYINQTHT